MRLVRYAPIANKLPTKPPDQAAPDTHIRHNKDNFSKAPRYRGDLHLRGQRRALLVAATDAIAPDTRGAFLLQMGGVNSLRIRGRGSKMSALALLQKGFAMTKRKERAERAEVVLTPQEHARLTRSWQAGDEALLKLVLAIRCIKEAKTQRDLARAKVAMQEHSIRSMIVDGVSWRQVYRYLEIAMPEIARDELFLALEALRARLFRECQKVRSKLDLAPLPDDPALPLSEGGSQK